MELESIDMSFFVDQKRQRENKKDCMSFKVMMMMMVIRSWCLWSAKDSSASICPNSEGVPSDRAATDKFLMGILLENSTKVY